MSMRTDCVYGIGFIVYASDEQLRKFCQKHRETIGLLDRGREILDYMDSCTPDEFNPKEDFFDYDTLVSCNEGFYGLIADVMYKETGISFAYWAGQEDDDDAIIFEPQYPWTLNSTEKELTLDKLEKICRQYIDDLGGQLGFDDDIRLEYFG